MILLRYYLAQVELSFFFNAYLFIYLGSIDVSSCHESESGDNQRCTAEDVDETVDTTSEIKNGSSTDAGPGESVVALDHNLQREGSDEDSFEESVYSCVVADGTFAYPRRHIWENGTKRQN